MTSTEIRPVKIREEVKVVTENYEECVGLVTAVHGEFSENGYVPCINVVLVSGDPTKVDPFGRQIERLSSLQHLSQGPSGMPRPGRYWVNL